VPLIAGMGAWERIRLIALRRTRTALTGELAGSRFTRVAVRGDLVSPVGLIAPLSNRPCVWYRMDVTRVCAEVRDTTNSSDERVWRYESTEPLSIDDGSGPAAVRMGALDKAVTVEGGNPREPGEPTRRLDPGDGWYREDEALARLVDDGLLPAERLASMETLRRRLAEDAQAPWGILLIVLLMVGLPVLLCAGLRVLVGLPDVPG
jgi:hypothetical protein